MYCHGWIDINICRSHETRWSCQTFGRKYTNLVENCIILQIWLWHSNEGSQCSSLEIWIKKHCKWTFIIICYKGAWDILISFQRGNTLNGFGQSTLNLSPTSPSSYVDRLKTSSSLGCLHYNWVNRDSRMFHKLCDGLVIHHCVIPALANSTMEFPWELGYGLELSRLIPLMCSVGVDYFSNVWYSIHLSHILIIMNCLCSHVTIYWYKNNFVGFETSDFHFTSFYYNNNMFIIYAFNYNRCKMKLSLTDLEVC